MGDYVGGSVEILSGFCRALVKRGVMRATPKSGDLVINADD